MAADALERHGRFFSVRLFLYPWSLSFGFKVGVGHIERGIVRTSCSSKGVLLGPDQNTKKKEGEIATGLCPKKDRAWLQELSRAFPHDISSLDL